MNRILKIVLFVIVFLIVLGIAYFIIGILGGIGEREHILQVNETDCKASYSTYLIHPISVGFTQVPSSDKFNKEQGLRDLMQCLCNNNVNGNIIRNFVYENSVLLWCAQRDCYDVVVDTPALKETRPAKCTKDNCFRDLQNGVLGNVESGWASSEIDFYCKSFAGRHQFK